MMVGRCKLLGCGFLKTARPISLKGYNSRFKEAMTMV
jgi:hypothetical protein